MTYNLFGSPFEMTDAKLESLLAHEKTEFAALLAEQQGVRRLPPSLRTVARERHFYRINMLDGAAACDQTLGVRLMTADISARNYPITALRILDAVAKAGRKGLAATPVQLMELTGTGRTVVERAMRRLRDNGLIIRLPKTGHYIVSEKGAVVAAELSTRSLP